MIKHMDNMKNFKEEAINRYFFNQSCHFDHCHNKESKEECSLKQRKKSDDEFVH